MDQKKSSMLFSVKKIKEEKGIITKQLSVSYLLDIGILEIDYWVEPH